ncbi:hypothetical protein MMC21_008465 [Puttea exsequens]|nr:hypothetical protein [Puttea exsequens]
MPHLPLDKIFDMASSKPLVLCALLFSISTPALALPSLKNAAPPLLLPRRSCRDDDQLQVPQAQSQYAAEYCSARVFYSASDLTGVAATVTTYQCTATTVFVSSETVYATTTLAADALRRRRVNGICVPGVRKLLVDVPIGELDVLQGLLRGALETRIGGGNLLPGQSQRLRKDRDGY